MIYGGYPAEFQNPQGVFWYRQGGYVVSTVERAGWEGPNRFESAVCTFGDYDEPLMQIQGPDAKALHAEACEWLATYIVET